MFKHVLKVELVEVGVFFEKSETEDHRDWKSRDRGRGANMDPRPRSRTLEDQEARFLLFLTKKAILRSVYLLSVLGEVIGDGLGFEVEVSKIESRLKNLRGPRLQRGLDFDQL